LTTRAAAAYTRAVRAALLAAKVTLLCGALLVAGAPANATGQFLVGASAVDPR